MLGRAGIPYVEALIAKIDSDVNIWDSDAKDRDIWKRIVAHAVNRIEERRMEDYQRRRQSRH